MRCLAYITLFLLCGNAALAQGQRSLGIAADGFVNALIDRDSAALKQLLDDKLVYGHSNGWMQSKRELISDLYNGKLIYKKIEQSDEQVTIEGSTGCVRTTVQLDVVMEGKPMQFKLHALQVWIWKNKNWRLLSRQSTKI